MQSSAAIVSTASESELLRSVSAGIATLTLNRHQQYNALSSSLIDALQAAMLHIKLPVVYQAIRGHEPRGWRFPVEQVLL